MTDPALKGIGLLCRTGGVIVHLTDEAERPIGFIVSGAAAGRSSTMDRRDRVGA